MDDAYWYELGDAFGLPAGHPIRHADQKWLDQAAIEGELTGELRNNFKRGGICEVINFER